MTDETHSDEPGAETGPGHDADSVDSTRGADSAHREESTPEQSRRLIETETGRLVLPPDATLDEAAAIAVALGAHVRDQRVVEESTEPGDTWHGKRFAFAGRTEALTGIPRRVPRGAPTDDWTAASRLDRL